MAVLLLWISCSVFCYFIMKSKGYPNDKCWAHCIGGFLLGVIWLIVVLCKKPYGGTSAVGTGNNHQSQQTNPQHVPQTASVQTKYIEAAQDITQEVAIQTIEKMARLKDKGILSQEEFEQKKSELLKKI